MAVPKRRKSRSKRDSRRANHKLSSAVYNECNNCGARRSVTPIKTGFVAISRGARKKNRA